MSYQFIYKTGKKAEGAEATVPFQTCSTDIPTALNDLLSGYCAGLEDLPGNTCDPFFCYRLLDCEGQRYHLLSGAARLSDGAVCIHHLALSVPEVQTLRNNINRPTPAGLIYALLQLGFWRLTDGANLVIEEAKGLTAGVLPDATSQPTWKMISGHKSNAKLFLTPPYHQKCLVYVPEYTPQADILKLINECDWLEPTSGWGSAFSTGFIPDGKPENWYRLVVRENQFPKLHAYVLSRRMPRIHVNQRMRLEEQPGNGPESAPLPWQRPSLQVYSQQPGTEHSSSRQFTYKYKEGQDEDTFNIPAQVSPKLRYIGGLLLLAVCGLGVNAIVSEWAGDAGEVVATELKTPFLGVDERVTKFQELISSPYSEESTARTLAELRAGIADENNRKAPENLKTCVRLLSDANTISSGHPQNIRKLNAAAEILAISQEALIRLYLLEAIRGKSEMEWQESLTEEEQKKWETLLEDFPQISHWLKREPFKDHFAGLFTEPEVHEEAHEVEAPLPILPDVYPTGSQFTEHATVTYTAHTRLPAALLAWLSDPACKPLSHGIYQIYRSDRDAKISIPLSPNGYQLIAEQVQPECYQLRVCKNGESCADIPVTTLHQHEGVLQSLLSTAEYTAVNIPILSNDSDLYNYLILPELKVQIYPTGNPLPPLPSGIRLTEKDIKVSESGLQAPEKASLQMLPKSNFPWIPMNCELSASNAPVNICLPRWSGINKVVTMQPEYSSRATRYNWSCTPVDSFSTMLDTYTCQLQQVFDFTESLTACFHRTVNSSCCGSVEGGDTFYSLATLYTLSKAIDEATDRHAFEPLSRQYLRLFSNDTFARILHRVLGGTPQLLISSADSRARTADAENERDRVSLSLRSAAMRKLIRQHILEYVSHELTETCKAEYNKQIRAPHPLIRISLQRAELKPNGELFWYFNLTTQEK